MFFSFVVNSAFRAKGIENIILVKRVNRHLPAVWDCRSVVSLWTHTTRVTWYKKQYAMGNTENASARNRTWVVHVTRRIKWLNHLRLHAYSYLNSYSYLTDNQLERTLNQIIKGSNTRWRICYLHKRKTVVFRVGWLTCFAKNNLHHIIFRNLT
jgi:hypothetical protein